MQFSDQSSNSQPKISIGMPIYNRPKALRRVLEELVNQTYQNLEIIVSDNASPDSEVGEVLKEFASRDNRIQYYIQPENRGAAHNWQYVLDKAAGQFFMWASDDDWHHPDFVAEMYKSLASDNTAVVAFCDFDSRDEQGDIVQGYPDFLSALKLMCEPSAFLRQVKYFLLNEGTAKPHPIYGLIRREALNGFSWLSFDNKYRCDALDALFVFWLMSQGRLALSEKRFFGCTVGNKKEYMAKGIKWNSSIYLKFIGRQIKYICGYLRIARGLTSFVLVLLFPLKLLELVNLYAIKPSANVIRGRLFRQDKRRV